MVADDDEASDAGGRCAADGAPRLAEMRMEADDAVDLAPAVGSGVDAVSSGMDLMVGDTSAGSVAIR
ncbi:hypothetical protein GUJ93_ZPchr0010g8654 [Zizania palustris]|uniref:Uncharacterized protein n=1 Tax=Zizania palustris TaxID=103762 RepID=A0A8J5TBH9_ZIZPA|nr:hypothetical protein GUJ93_ZPchr0010g8654 [Zizania palustris]